MPVLAGVFGVLLLIAVLGEAFETMLLPRRIRRQLRFIPHFFRFTWGAWSVLGRRCGTGRFRDAFLSVYGPFSMLLLLGCWVAGLILGFGLFQWAIQYGLPKSPSLLAAMYLSGANLFTLTAQNVQPITRLAKSVAVFEGGTGLAFLAVTIGYLPVLYQLYSRREADVIQLDARAGSPPTSVVLLCRHAENEALEELAKLIRQWEQWCAELIESHLSYPMLSYYRSQHDNQSWLAALAALMDTCALLLTGFKGVRTFSARMTFAMARLALVELCRIFRQRPQLSEKDRLPPEDFPAIQSALSDAGLVFSDEGSAEERLNAFRATYEPFLFALSSHFMLPLPAWLAEDSPDNWQRSSRGKSARQLVDSAPAQPE
jgi:hypothetical protein